ncbi:MAG TPA: DUF6600 domain-containing protein [Chthonomonadaceae bacterium]|nr:DUF6600 domain-containing protein [Chthonomonadaceae bacterium]
MVGLSKKLWIGAVCFTALFSACMVGGKTAWAQEGSDRDADPGFAQAEGGNGETPQNAANAGPVRLARFAYISGNVTFRCDDHSEWAAATVNMPLRQGAQIWVTDGGRAEIQFDDGSMVRFGNGAVATLQTLYSDADGEFTEINLSDGLAYLHLRQDHSIYQVDTPLVSVKAVGPAKVRVGAGEGVEVGVHAGRATVEGSQGNATLEAGDYLDLHDANDAYNVRNMPRADSWASWNEERDQLEEAAAEGASHRHLPSNIDIVSGDLDAYGSWRNDPQYGYVWCPRALAVDWRPYNYGHWVWVNPFGWTWVSDEPWGWAPYHYGTWVHASYGWGWCPGPTCQYWSPAVVHFSECEGRVAWVPLAPVEVHYPPVLAIGFRGGNWAAFFSIGQAAVYYPVSSSYCEARPFNTVYVNRVTYVNNVTVINNYNNLSPSTSRYQMSAEYFAANHNTYLNGRSFVPVNARVGGASAVSVGAFGGRGTYTAMTASQSVAHFTQGRTVTAPSGNSAPVAGPQIVKPTAEALAPTRTFVRTATTTPPALNRSVYRAPVAPTIARSAQPITPAGVPLPNRGPRAGNANTGSALSGNNTSSGRTGQTGVNSGGRGFTSNGNGTSGTSNGTQRGSTTGTTGTTGSSASDAARRARESLGVPTRGSSSSTGSSGQSSGRNDSSNGTGRGSSGNGENHGNTSGNGSGRSNPPSNGSGNGSGSSSGGYSGRGSSGNNGGGSSNSGSGSSGRGSSSGNGGNSSGSSNSGGYSGRGSSGNNGNSSGSSSGNSGRGSSSGNNGGGSSNSGNSSGSSGRGYSSGSNGNSSGGSGGNSGRGSSGGSEGSGGRGSSSGNGGGSSNNSGGRGSSSGNNGGGGGRSDNGSGHSDHSSDNSGNGRDNSTRH